MMRQIFTTALFALLFIKTAFSQPVFDAMQWRMIGPHRGGRTVGAVGIPGQPNTFFIGVNNGGVWKTDDAGRTWLPIFDDQPTGSVGDIAVSPRDPNTMYVASGEGLQRPDLSVGNGIYKTTDGGKTWKNTGLPDGLQIGGLAIDPKNPERVFAAVLGHPYGANAERGVFRTLDGGKNWQKILFKDENTGAIQVALDPSNPMVVYADLFAARLAPWENGQYFGPESGLYKSTDGGATWKKLTNGLPTATENGLGRIGFCICPSNPQRLYATVNATEKGGIYRSEDGGENWKLMNPDGRLWGRGDDFAEIKADPKNADIVYTANVMVSKSTDGGQSWRAFRGAPGGDDYHRIWINPDDPAIILLASDQGAIITVNGGRTFSSWYNQPTAQFYHVSADNDFPYNVLGGQQESGSVCIASRGRAGGTTFRDWAPAGGDEYGYLCADPLDPNLVYGGGIFRFDKRTGQVQDIRPDGLVRGLGGKYRMVRTSPSMFSMVDKKTLFFAGNVLFSTKNGGESWETRSPDLSRPDFEIPQNVGVFTEKARQKDQKRRGVIYSIAPSPLDLNTVWAGTDDGLIWLTMTGGGEDFKNWQNVTPPNLPAWSKVSQLDAGHFDKKTAYAAVNAMRLDDLRPYIFKTKNGGASWQEITRGLPENEPINVVREDHLRPGLLFAGSENAVYVSLDDGENWQSLRLNMPATSIRDLVVKDDDLVIGTHGRSFWILDDISPLRELAQLETQNPKPVTFLFKPQLATRVRWNLNTDTPLPQEEPAGQNPPDGAIINYFLGKKPALPVVLEIVDAAGQLIRRYASDDPKIDHSIDNVPPYWLRPQTVLSGEKGAHRFCWDLRLQPMDVRWVGTSYPIAAVFGNTATEATAPFAMPGNYTVRLTVDGVKMEQPLTLRMDPRVKTPLADLQKQFDLSLFCYQNRMKTMGGLQEIASFKNQLKERQVGAKPATADFLKKTDDALTAVLENKNQNFERLDGQLDGLFGSLQGSDFAPTAAMVSQKRQAETDLKQLLEKLDFWKKHDLADLNLLLKKNKAAPVSLLADSPEFAKHPEKTDSKDWRPLFDKALSDAVFQPGKWSWTASGELTASEDNGIFTKKLFNDFQLDFEIKTTEGMNSGILLHCTNPENWIPNSVEVQIADDFAQEWAESGSTWQCGAIFGHLAATKHAGRPAGEWNRMTITCIDRKIWVVLNGELVNAMDMALWKSGRVNPNGTAIPPWLPVPFAEIPLKGSIGFQGQHGGSAVFFRNARVREL